MKLVVTEKNDAATKIAALLGVKKPKADKVYSTPVYRFEVDGEEWVTIGLRGHILEPDFTPTLIYKKRGGWRGVTAEGEAIPAQLPASLARPPFKKKKPFIEDGVELKAWKMDALPYLIYAPIEKLPKEKEIIRSLKNLAKKADSIVIATDFDREGELIGSDALSCIQEVNPTAPVSRARYSAFTKEEITHAFSNLVELDTNLASAGASRQDIDLIWGAVLTRYLTLVKFAGYGNVRSSGRVQTPTLALIVARERERLAFIPEDYWVIKGAFDAAATAGPTAGDGELAFTAPHSTARFKDEAAAKAAMAAVAAARAAERLCGVPITIKWVNDLWKNGKKVCGILTEAALDLESGMLDYAVLGLGFNVAAPADGWPEDLRDVAGALYDGSPAPGARAALAAAFLNAFWPLYRTGPRSGYLDEYRRRQALTGQRVLVTPRRGTPRAAQVLGIDDECKLVVRFDGESRPAALNSGEVSVRLL